MGHLHGQGLLQLLQLGDGNLLTVRHILPFAQTLSLRPHLLVILSAGLTFSPKILENILWEKKKKLSCRAVQDIDYID